MRRAGPAGVLLAALLLAALLVAACTSSPATSASAKSTREHHLVLRLPGATIAVSWPQSVLPRFLAGALPPEDAPLGCREAFWETRESPSERPYVFLSLELGQGARCHRLGEFAGPESGLNCGVDTNDGPCRSVRIFSTDGTWFDVEVIADTAVTQSIARSVRVLSTDSLAQVELRAVAAVATACVQLDRLHLEEVEAPPWGLEHRAVVLREVRSAEIYAKKAQELDGSWPQLVRDTKVLVAGAEARNWRTVFASGIPGAVLLGWSQYCGHLTGSTPVPGTVAPAGKSG